MTQLEKSYEYWQDLYLLHSETKGFRVLVQKTKDIIHQYLDLGVKSYGSISGGKDSTAMMHLIHSVAPNTGFVSEKDDMDFPGELEYMRLLETRYKLSLTILSPEVKLWDILINHDFTEDIHSKGIDFSDRYFYDILKAYQKENNYKGVFLGLRAKESKGRLWNVKTNGNIYYNQDWQQLVCQPLAQWSAKDVFAYLFANEVPTLDVYFKTKFVESPEEIRKSWILPSAQSSQGQALWLKYYYPEIYQKLCTVNPKLRAFI